MGTRVPGGILVPDVALYDAVGHGSLMRPLQRRIAADVAAATSPAASVLEVGCGPAGSRSGWLESTASTSPGSIWIPR